MKPLFATMKPIPVLPVEEIIELALDHGIDPTAAIDALDALEGDENLEDEPFDEGHSDNVWVTETCSLGHEHRDERIDVL